MLYDVNCCLFTELGDLSFSLHFVCASYEHELYMCFELHHDIFTEVQSMYFCEFLLIASSLLSRVLDVVVLLG